MHMEVPDFRDPVQTQNLAKQSLPCDATARESIGAARAGFKTIPRQVTPGISLTKYNNSSLVFDFKVVGAKCFIVSVQRLPVGAGSGPAPRLFQCQFMYWPDWRMGKPRRRQRPPTSIQSSSSADNKIGIVPRVNGKNGAWTFNRKQSRQRPLRACHRAKRPALIFGGLNCKVMMPGNFPGCWSIWVAHPAMIRPLTSVWVPRGSTFYCNARRMPLWPRVL